ncbi:MAG: YeeE/YedE thiosulfate transporter family protein, partial [Thermoanaerobaculia bacterium]
MTTFPLPLADIFGHWGSYAVYLVIGIAFGAVLEMAGFGNSRKLAAQFYFQDLTVLKVMFTGIIVAMVLVFAATAVGLLDYNLLWVNPTYLWPGIVGGLIMGAGFIIGGFCPGTSLVAMATLKKDGLFFVLGVLAGIFLFGETVDQFAIFWNSSYMGRFTLPELFGLPTGVVVLLVVLMALVMFWGGEKLEQHFGGKDPKKAPKWRYAAAGMLIAGAFALIFIGQPTFSDRWAAVAEEKNALLENRER